MIQRSFSTEPLSCAWTLASMSSGSLRPAHRIPSDPHPTLQRVLQLRAYGPPDQMADVATRLAALPGSRHVMRTPSEGAGGATLVTADVGGQGAADAALAAVRRLGVHDDNVELLRIDSIGPASSSNPLANVVWADLLGQAGTNARLLARYLVFMGIAGIIAVFGVVYSNGILIVGAMAVSPDILPVTATCVALVLGRAVLARRSFATLIIGMVPACVVAALMTGAWTRSTSSPMTLPSTCRRSTASTTSTPRRSSSRSSPAWRRSWPSRPAPPSRSAWRSR